MYMIYQQKCQGINCISKAYCNVFVYSGRSHQLRVHCDHIGHRIVGDYMYSNRQDTSPYRMMLHSLRLKFGELDILSTDPFTPTIDDMWKVTDVINTYS